MAGSEPTWQLPPTLPNGAPWPKISIVTPSFNQGEFIEETIDSVLRQRYPAVEHIIVDGGSTDATVDVLARRAADLAHVVMEPDDGQSDALNKGFTLATGDILTWLNSDDRLSEGALAAIAMAFHQSGADMVAGICTLFDETGIQHAHLTGASPGLLSLNKLLDRPRYWDRGYFFYQPEVMFTRSIWQRAGAFVDPALHYLMDYELWCRFAANGAKLAVIGRPVAELRLHPAQKTHALHSGGSMVPRMAEEFRKLADRYGGPDATAPANGRVFSSARRVPGRILAVNDLGFQYGAGTAHRRIVEAFRYAGHHVTTLKLGEEETVVLAEQRRRFPKLVKEARRDKPRLVLVGNVHGATRSAAVLSDLVQVAPVAAVLHDFFLLTGRCAYMAGCQKAVHGCNADCPTPAEYPQLHPDRIARAWQEKRDWLASPSAPVLLANSRWTETLARRLAGNTAWAGQIRSFRLPVPAHVFRPLDRSAMRAALGLPVERPILACAAAHSDLRKGMGDICRAVANLSDRRVVLLVLGPPNLVPRINGVDVIARGPLSESDMAKHLASSDVAVSASQAETFGQTMMEAAMAGTPAVAYRGSGLEDAVVEGVTGLLTEPHPSALTAAIGRLLDDAGLRARLGYWARLHAENWYSHAASYHSLRTALAGEGRLQEGLFSAGITLDRRYAIASITLCPAASETLDAVNPSAPGMLYRLARELGRRLPWASARWMRTFAHALRWLP